MLLHSLHNITNILKNIKSTSRVIDIVVFIVLIAIVIFSLFPIQYDCETLTSATIAYASETPDVSNSNENANEQKPSTPYMTDLDPKKLFETDSDSGANRIISGGTSIIQNITTSVLLPIAILFAAWRVLYMAIFPILAGIDPLGMLEKNKTQENMHNFNSTKRWNPNEIHSSNMTGTKIREEAKQQIKKELFDFGKALFIIIIVWSLIQFLYSKH